MKRVILTALLGWMASVAMMPAVVTERQARKVAQSFVKSGARSVVPQPTLVYTGMAGHSGARSVKSPAFYVYNYEGNQGFVIISAEDTTLPILAFSHQGSFATGQAMPVQVASWLQGYCDYIQQVRSGSRYVEPAPDLGIDITVAIEPLVKARWDQTAPYSDLCPPYDAVENCATGCTATAIAQIMHHHKWPETGEGSATFDGKVVDFSQSQYDWDNMLDTYDYGVSYPKVQTQAVAKLMYDVGVSAEMQYGYESGTQNVYIYRSLYTHFKYSKQMQYIVRNCMTTAEWKNRIREELEAGRPVYYGGFAEDMSMGHAFVCDGIDETGNYFHFNWGWSGHCNGFYFLNSLNPSVLGIGGGVGNFNADHVAIVGIQPAKENEEDTLIRSVVHLRKGFYTNTSQTTLGRNFYAQIGNVWNLGPEPLQTKLAVAMYDKEGTLLDIIGHHLDISLSVFSGASNVSIPISIPKGLPEGEYELRAVYGSEELGWKEAPYYHDCYQHSISFVVEGSSVRVLSPARSEVSLQALLRPSLPATLLPGKNYPIQLDYQNIGEWNFDGHIGCRLLQLPKVTDGPQTTLPDADTLTIWQKEITEFIYSEDSKSMEIDCRLTEPADYLLQAYYVDPLSLNEVVAGEWTLTLAAPTEEYTRRVVLEQTWQNGDHRAMQQLMKTYPDNLIGITVKESVATGYIDSLALPIGVTALMNRVRNSSLTSVAEAESHLKEWLEVPVIATVEAQAKYTTRAKDSVEVKLATRFAYTAKDVDMRLAVVTLNHSPIDGDGAEWIYTDMATGFYPTDAWSGASGVIPDDVKAGETYTYTLTLKPEYTDELALVGLLIDGETGEILNAVSLSQEEIAPMDGEVIPTAINLERTEAMMNKGLRDVRLNASVSPAIAPQELVWTSSNPEVATFDEWGQLMTLSAGTTNLRATSAYYPEVYAEMQLTVQETDYSQIQQVEAGYLHYLVDMDTCPDRLMLGGEINGTDIALLRTLCGGDNIVGDLIMPLACPLDSLDISQCRIVAGGKPYYKDYVTENDVVGKEMFKWCIFLEEIVLPANLVAIGDNAFAESGRGRMKSMEIPATVKSIGYAPFYGCQGFESFSVAKGNTTYKAVDGVLYNYAGTELVAYPAAKQDSLYESIETLNRILPYAFNGASGLKAFQGNLRLSSIGYGAFYGASHLSSVHLSNRLNFVDEYAFAQCTALKYINCKRVTPSECAINAFEGVPEDCILELPDNFDEEYYVAPGWNRFTNVTTSIEPLSVEEGIRVSSTPGGFTLWGTKAGEQVFVYSPTGVLVTCTETMEGKTPLSVTTSGIYIVRLSGFSAKVVVK